MAAATTAMSMGSACYSCHPLALIRVERLPFCVYRNSANVKFSWQIKSRIYQHNSYYSLSQNQHHLFGVLSLQAVAAENDFKSSDAPGPSSMESACSWPGGEGSNQSLFQSLQSLQIWLRNITKDDHLHTLRKGFGGTIVGLLTLDVKQAVLPLKTVKLDLYMLEWWQNTSSWIKWPFAIFVPWYFVVSMAYGFSVSSDLLPLWILGPLGVAFAIKTWLQLLSFCRWFAMYTASTKFAAGFIQLYEYAKGGQLPQHIKGLGQFAEKKKSEVVLYVESGQFVADLKKLFVEKLLELRAWSLETYDDNRQRLRLFWVTLSRTLQRIF